jgi:hypothetical protein
MRKRMILVEIDCEDKTCGDCELRDSEYGDHCAAFGFTKLKGEGEYNSWPYQRLPACLAAEVKEVVPNTRVKCNHEYYSGDHEAASKFDDIQPLVFDSDAYGPNGKRARIVHQMELCARSAVAR